LRTLALLLGMCLAVAFAGCGGSSSSTSSFPELGSQKAQGGPAHPGVMDGWVSLSGNTFTTGSTLAEATAVVVNPLRLRMRVDASPDVVTETSYEVDCDEASSQGQKASATTPIVREIEIPRGLRAGRANDVQCTITAQATKPASGSMTLSLFERLPARSAHR
jgi:hypothetical protein